MNKKILTIGFDIPGFSNLCLSYFSKTSLMDFDMTVFRPEIPNGLGSSYQGKISYDEDGSFEYKEYTQYWKSELYNFIKSGKTVFLLLTEKESFYLSTGIKEYKSKMTINHVDLHDNYEFLPLNIGSVTTAKGKNIEFSGNTLFTNFFRNFNKNLEYHVYLEKKENSSVVFTGKDKSKVLGAVYEVGAGHLIALPYLNYDTEKFIKIENENGEEIEYWTPEAEQFGHTLIDCLLEIDNGLTQEFVKLPPPEWALNEKYISKKESKIKKEIDENIAKIQKTEQDNKNLQVELQKEQILKDLLYEQGKPLENAVIKALEILGFKAENYKDNNLELDQVIISPEGYRYIGECEGKNDKDIDITKFRQLLESLNADFARENVNEKAYGILFGNPQRLIVPQSRTLDFTQKCKIGAEREKIALVRTADLFEIVKYLNENNDIQFQEQCRNAIHTNLGKIVKFPQVPIDTRIKK